MTNNTWIATVLRFARQRACCMLQAQPPNATAPDYDVPAFIRRGVRIPALEAFHREGSAIAARTTGAKANDDAGDEAVPHRVAMRCPY